MSETPVNQLPPEILAEIFCLIPSKGIELVVRNSFPWKFALVCRFWRDIVFSTPQLWANIKVELDPVGMSKTDIRSDALIASWELCLERSRSYPLSVVLGTCSSKSVALIPPLLKSLMEHVGQWRTVVFGFPVGLFLPFVSGHDVQYPHLRDVSLRGGVGTTILPETKLFRGAPLLSRISIERFQYPPRGIGLPWTQITDLSMHMNVGDVRDLLDVLRSTSTLTMFEFFAWSTTSPPDTRPNHILQLPHLQKLAWTTYVFDISYFFDSISMPSLSELIFRCEDNSWNRESMQRFLCRSRCTIISVTLSMANSYLASSFLNILPDVEFIGLYDVPGDNELMRTLTFDESATSWICPRLKKIVMSAIHIQEEVREAFVTMVQSRVRVPVNLDPTARVPERGRRLESLQLEIPHYHANVPQNGTFGAFKILQERLSPEEMALVVCTEKT